MTPSPTTSGGVGVRARAAQAARAGRRLVALVVLLCLLTPVGVASAGPRPATGHEGAARLPPVPGAPVRAFEAPAHDYGPGHRGVDLPAVHGQQVRAPAAGTVAFAGPVAGRGVVVLEHAGGTLTSLEPVEALLPRGSTVTVGTPVALLRTGPAHAGCPEGCLHWGVRVDGRYVDPWWWLGRTAPVRLLPWLQSPFDLPGVAVAAPRDGPTGPVAATRAPARWVSAR